MLNILKKIFVGDQSTTNNLITMLTIGLIAMTVFALVYYPMTLFEKLLTAYIGVYGTIQGFKQGRSMPQQTESDSKKITTTVVDNTENKG